VNYITLHRYWGQELSPEIRRDRTPSVFLGDWERHFDEYITTTKNQIQVARVRHGVTGKPFHIGFTEWSPGTNNHLSTLAGALHFNLFLRHADAVKRANFTMFTSLLARTREGETYRTPFFHMFKLFSNHAHGTSLDVLVDSETFDGKMYSGIPYLDVSASYAEGERLMVINVVNRNMERAVSTRIISDTGAFVGNATVSVINGEDLNAPYTFEQRESYAPATSTLRASGRTFNYSFPPHSFTQIRVRVE
jgi:alpha-L-arabinofuranosidase